MSRRKQKSTATAASRGGRKSKAKKVMAQVRDTITEISPYIDLLVNPWTASLENAGCPDYNQKPIVEWRETTLITVTPEATNGNFCYCINSMLNDAIKPLTYSAGVPNTWGTASDVNNYTSMATHFTFFRTFAVSVKAYYMGQADSAKGLFAVCTAPNLVTYDQATFSLMCDEQDFRECPAQEAAAAVQRFHATGFNAIANTAVNDADSRGVIYVMGTGLPVTACVRLEITWVGEFMIDPASVFTRQAHRTIVHPAQVHAAANISGPEASTATGKDPTDKLAKLARKAAKAGALVNGVVTAFEQYGPLIASMM